MKKEEKRALILMADDDPDDRLFNQDALEQAGLTARLELVENGQELMDFLHCKGKYEDRSAEVLPDLIVLDLNMPKMDGNEVLSAIKSDPTLRYIPVIMLTTSHSEADIRKSYDLGVSGYITKPLTFKRLIEIMKTVGKYWFDTVVLPDKLTGGSL